MEAVLEHSERTLAEIVDNMYYNSMSKQDTSTLWQAFYITWKQTVSVGRGFVIFFSARFVVTLCKLIKCNNTFTFLLICSEQNCSLKIGRYKSTLPLKRLCLETGDLCVFWWSVIFFLLVFDNSGLGKDWWINSRLEDRFPCLHWRESIFFFKIVASPALDSGNTWRGDKCLRSVFFRW